MKKKIFMSLLAVILMLQTILPVKAAELTDSAAEEDTTDSQNGSGKALALYDDDGTPVIFSNPVDSTRIPDDELVGINATTPNTFTLTGPSVSGYAIINGWNYFYIYNRTGASIRFSNIYLDGTYGSRNETLNNNMRNRYHNNDGIQAVLYYKYDASTRHLLTTWSNIDDWEYLDVFPTVVNWEYNAIKYCSDNRLMVGTGDNVFDPNVAITRGMFATIVYRMAGSPKVTSASAFSDIRSDAWFKDGVTWASQMGIVKGFGDGSYRPYEVITREQAAAILQRYADWRGYGVDDRASLSRFPDNGTTSSWAMENVKWAVAMGLMSGKPVNNQLCLVPKGQASRAECASMLMRFREGIGN